MVRFAVVFSSLLKKNVLDEIAVNVPVMRPSCLELFIQLCCQTSVASLYLLKASLYIPLEFFLPCFFLSFGEQIIPLSAWSKG